MSWLQALLLGAVQGATEFLPISSSGHLALVPWVLEWEIDPAAALPFAVVAHWGTVLAVVVMLRSELWELLVGAVRGLATRKPLSNRSARMAWLLALATLPAAAAGALFRAQVEQAFGAPRTVALLLWGTAALLLVGEALTGANRSQLSAVRVGDALLIGLAQALALFPGISRSGATMAAGISRGFSRTSAARFSFLLAIPIMLGAGAVSLIDLLGAASSRPLLTPLLMGFASSAAVGGLAIRWLLSYLQRGSLRIFAVYCLVAGAAALSLSVLRA